MHANPWPPYTPTKEAPWDLRRVVHLHRRAGFAASWVAIQRDLKDGFEASIARVLQGGKETPPAGGAGGKLFSDTLATMPRTRRALKPGGFTACYTGRTLWASG